MEQNNGTAFPQKLERWIYSKSGCHLKDFCRKFGYYPLALKIMALDENDEKKSKAFIGKDNELKGFYIKAAKDPYTIRRKGENRSFTEYFKYLIAGWVVEDLVIEMLKEQGLEVEHNGRDAQRKIAIGNEVSQEADIRIKVGKVVRKVELTNEFNNFIEKQGFIEKRAPSLLKLWKGKGIWIYRDLRIGKYVLIDFATEKVRLHLRRHNNVSTDWSKDVHRYVLSENGKKIRDDKLLAAEIISVVGCSIEGKEQPQIDEVIDSDSPPVDFGLGGKRKGSVAPPIATQKISGQNTQAKEVSHGSIQKSQCFSAQSKDVRKSNPKPTNPAGEVHPVQTQVPVNKQDEEELPADYDYGDGDFV